MEPIKFFSLNKNTKSKDTQPDYRMMTKTKDTFVELGACWIKKDKKGNSYLSCKLGDAWMDGSNGEKNKKGFHIEEDEKYEALEQAIAPTKPKTAPEREESEEIGF